MKVGATGVGATDIAMRRGFYPYAPPIPFVPGYESVGIVDTVGAGVTTLKAGDRVCALLVHGGYATHAPSARGTFTAKRTLRAAYILSRMTR